MSSKQENSIFSQNKSKSIIETVMYVIFFICSLSAIIAVFAITIYMVVSGTPALFKIGIKDMLFNPVWQPTGDNPSFGIAYIILTSIIGTFFSILIGVPIGILTAVFLSEIANKKVYVFIKPCVELLAGIPSIIYGLFGMVFFGVTLNLKFSILCGSLTLTIMILPVIIRTTTESLRTVPKGYRDGAIGMGSTKWYMIRTIILPSAAPGIVTGTILAMGRIIGESAALLFTAGSVYLLPKNLFTHIFNSGGTLTIQMYLSMSKAEYDNAFGIGFVLLCLVFLLNILTKLILKSSKK